MSDNPRESHAARGAAEIVNLLNLSDPKDVQFSRVLRTILHVMDLADGERASRLYRPSDN